jgi:hypothetical protein
MSVIISLIRFLCSRAWATSFDKGFCRRFIFVEMGDSGASVSSAIILLAGCPCVTLKMFLPFLFLPAVWFDRLPFDAVS